MLCQAVDPQTVPEQSWIHIDPDRRPGERRVADPQHSEPPLATLEALSTARARGGDQVGSGRRSSRALEPQWGAGVGQPRWELSSANRLVRDRAGRRAPGRRRPSLATGPAHTFVARCNREGASQSKRLGRWVDWIFDFDPAVRAAGLTERMAGRLDLRTLGGPAGFLTADRLPIQSRCAVPLYQSFEVLWKGADG